MDVAGLDVLDFGCGGGALLALLAPLGPRSLTGIDVDPHSVAMARTRLDALQLHDAPRLLVAGDPGRIDLPDHSMDAIFCFDTVEHVLDYERIIREWRRVLRRDGRIFIWWCPWFHPYGHHVESLIPLPWAHVVFAEPVLTATCARIYDLPEFRPRAWDVDEAGNRKPNKWRTLTALPGLNRLTMRRFERACAAAGLCVVKRRVTGFRGSPAARLTQPLTRVPMLGEFFTAHVTYELGRARA